MKAGEIKLKLVNSVNRLIDTYYGMPTISEKLINATLKVIVKQNLYKVDDILKIFADQNGEINPQEILVEYAQQIGDNGITIDIRDYINNDMLKNMMPNKILIIKKEDILNLIV
jgi:hypothetical protein